jgi:IS4 transposase
MDSWFISDYTLQAIRSIHGGLLHVVGMYKMDRRRFRVGDKEYNSQTIIKMNETKKEKVHHSRKYHSKYMETVADYCGTPVKLFHIRYKNAQNWTLLLTTDLSLSFAQAMELYQIRWSIEVMYKECKQYLRLGKAQNTDFYGQIADATLTLIYYARL